MYAGLTRRCEKQYAKTLSFVVVNDELMGGAADYNSVFPAGVNVAATFDRGLAYARGAAMGAEHRGKGVDVQLGPVAGPLGRSPEGGRNWEGFRLEFYHNREAAWLIYHAALIQSSPVF